MGDMAADVRGTQLPAAVLASPESRDPRPLVGEPLPLDLLNTHWIEASQLRDLLDTIPGTMIWLGSAVIEPDYRPRRIDEAHRAALRAARDILLAVAEQPHDDAARAAFNDLLARGHRHGCLGPDGPTTKVVIADPVWTVPWLAAEAYLDLLDRLPDRIRQCQHPDCVLWYLDTSPSGRRRWCSMSICGNRSKARRHYNRSKPN